MLLSLLHKVYLYSYKILFVSLTLHHFPKTEHPTQSRPPPFEIDTSPKIDGVRPILFYKSLHKLELKSHCIWYRILCMCSILNVKKAFLLFCITAVVFTACSGSADVPQTGADKQLANYKLLEGTVYEDKNSNGAYDSGEEIAGIKVTSQEEDPLGSSTDVTGTNGKYWLVSYSEKPKVTVVFKSTESALKKYKSATVEVDFYQNAHIENYNVALEAE